MEIKSTPEHTSELFYYVKSNLASEFIDEFTLYDSDSTGISRLVCEKQPSDELMERINCMLAFPFKIIWLKEYDG